MKFQDFKHRGLGNKDQPVRGILQSHLQAQHRITDNLWVLQCIQGYRLEFGDMLPPDNWPCNLSLLTQVQSRFWTKRFKICSKKRDRKRIQHEWFLQLNVHCPQKGWRLEAKCLNAHLAVSRFKMEGIGSLKDVLQEGNFMGKINLEDAYLSVPVHQEH